MTIAAYLEERSIPEPNSGCYLWLRARNPDGYGVFGTPTRLAHRAAYEAAKGPIPAGMCLLHKCDNPACINVDHLKIGTQADNMADKMKKGRHVSHGGERHGRAKLSNQQVHDIRASTQPIAALARDFGVSKSLISMIRTGKRWRHL